MKTNMQDREAKPPATRKRGRRESVKTKAAQPIERKEVPRTVVDLQERCTSCGGWVAFEQYKTAGHLRYVRCPNCGARHALNLREDTIRTIPG